MKQTTEILQHEIEWWVQSKAVKELPEIEIEHITASIVFGYSQGELNIGWLDSRKRFHETRGWWNIKKCAC